MKSSELAQLATQTNSLQQQVNEYRAKYSAAQEKVTLKQRELEAVKEEAPSTGKIAELEKKLKDAETKSSAMTAEAQFTIHRDNMIKAYDELLKMLTALDRTDPEMKEKYRKTASMIVENMAKTLKIWPPIIKKIYRLILPSLRGVKSNGLWVVILPNEEKRSLMRVLPLPTAMDIQIRHW